MRRWTRQAKIGFATLAFLVLTALLIWSSFWVLPPKTACLVLQGAAVQNKGMALFPRRIRGRYAMLSRQDNENVRIMFSRDLYCWESSGIVARPARA